jgi:uncharacterized protein
LKKYGIFPDLPVEDNFVYCGKDGSITEQWILLGELAEYGKRRLVRFDISKEKVISIVGRRGQGKSYTLGSIIEGLCTTRNSDISKVNRDRALLLFDPLNIFQWTYIPLEEKSGNTSDEIKRQISRLNRWQFESVPLSVDIWVPAGYKSSLYPLQYKDLFLGISDFTLDDWAALTGFDLIRDVRGQFLSELINKVSNTGWHDSEGNDYSGRLEYGIPDLIECAENDAEIDTGYYRDDSIRAVLQRLSSFNTYPVFSATGTKLNELLQPGKLSVILLNKLPEDLRTVVVGVMSRQILKDRSEASENIKDLMLNTKLTAKERTEKEIAVSLAIPKTWIIIDEIQTILPVSPKTAATDALIKLVKEGRNFGLSFVCTTQQPKAVHPAVMSQSETFIIHRLISQSDIDAVLTNLKSPIPTEISDEDRKLDLSELIRELSIGNVLISDAFSKRAFTMEVRPRVSAHGGFEA